MKSTSAMATTCWNAMSEAASLRANQQQIAKKFLTLHFGGHIVESDHTRAKFSNDCVKHKKQDCTHSDGRVVQLWHRSLKDMLQFYVLTMKSLQKSNRLMSAFERLDGSTKNGEGRLT